MRSRTCRTDPILPEEGARSPPPRLAVRLPLPSRLDTL
jgi:hypothetical protein